MPNRRTIVLGIAAMPIALGATRAFAQEALTGDAIATSEGDVTIHPVGHASLALGFGAHVLYIDPAKEDVCAQLGVAYARPEGAPRDRDVVVDASGSGDAGRPSRPDWSGSTVSGNGSRHRAGR